MTAFLPPGAGKLTETTNQARQLPVDFARQFIRSAGVDSEAACLALRVLRLLPLPIAMPRA